ncbi:MAG: FHA domain-containing protein [Candidatus Eremiobacteraeota bacterium]|nr:FHA domain-containing protein [Candidatus Eremiobacteraeota bacterium]
MSALLSVAADFDRQMRIGTLEITAALALVALLAARPRIRTAADIGALTPMLVHLEVIERGGRRTQQLRSPFELGRARDAEVFLHDSEVSRRHARFESHNGAIYVEDLGSRNGTFLNGRRIDEAIEIRVGDEIDIGTTRLVVRSVRPA